MSDPETAKGWFIRAAMCDMMTRWAYKMPARGTSTQLFQFAREDAEKSWGSDLQILLTEQLRKEIILHERTATQLWKSWAREFVMGETPLSTETR